MIEDILEKLQRVWDLTKEADELEEQIRRLTKKGLSLFQVGIDPRQIRKAVNAKKWRRVEIESELVQLEKDLEEHRLK